MTNTLISDSERSHNLPPLGVYEATKNKNSSNETNAPLAVDGDIGSNSLLITYVTTTDVKTLGLAKEMTNSTVDVVPIGVRGNLGTTTV